MSESGAAEPSQRLHWMDALRGGAILLVVVFHATSLLRFAGLASPEALAIFNTALAPFRMPMLMFLSGMLLSQSIAKGWRRYFDGKLRNVAWPYVVWTVLLALVVMPPLTLDTALQYTTGGTYLFFIAFLAVNYVVGFALRRVHPLVVAVLALAISVVPHLTTALDFVPHRFVEDYWYLLAFFMLGTWAQRDQDQLLRAIRNKWIVLASLCLAVTAGYISVRSPDITTYDTRYVWGAAAGVLVAISVTHLALRRASGSVVTYIGRNSIVFYVSHWPVIYLFMTLVGPALPNVSVVVAAAAASTALAVGFGLAWVRHRNVVASALFALPARRGPRLDQSHVEPRAAFSRSRSVETSR